MKNVDTKLIRSQIAARSKAKIYRLLAKQSSNKKMRKVWKQLAADEKKTASALKGVAGVKAKPNFLLVKLKKELYKGISQRDLYNLTVARRWINQKRFSWMTEAKAAETEVKPKFTQHLAATTAAAGEHLAAMKKLM